MTDLATIVSEMGEVALTEARDFHDPGGVLFLAGTKPDEPGTTQTTLYLSNVSVHELMAAADAILAEVVDAVAGAPDMPIKTRRDMLQRVGTARQALGLEEVPEKARADA